MHRPVMVNEVLELLPKKRGGVYIDGTVGSGGHAEVIIEAMGPGGFLLGIDRDEDAIRRAETRLANWKRQCVLVHGNFGDMIEIAKSNRIDRVDGVLLDIGVSSEQLDSPERGFSFNAEGPLDMRMDTSHGETAADIVNNLGEEELCLLLRRFGEESNAARIARAIVRERARSPITTTTHLADLIAGAMGGRRGRLHPATRTFQALRIRVNNEMDALEKGLLAGLNLLACSGRMAVISFHSLEARIAKNVFKRHTGKWESLQEGGRRWVVDEPAVGRVTRKPIAPSDAEVQGNPRSRSAKLRVVERIADNKRQGETT